MLKSIQRLLTILLLVVGLLFLGYQAFLYNMLRDRLPTSMTVASIDVGGMTREKAAATLNEYYFSPITLNHLQEKVDINPKDVGFTLDVEGMLDQAEVAKGERPFMEGFLEYLLKQSFEPTEIQLMAAHDRAALQAQLENIASLLDRPATAPQLLLGAGSYQPGDTGYITNVEASLPAVEMALYQLDAADRQVDLVIEMQESTGLGIDVLRGQLERTLADDAVGLVGSIFIMDLQTGEEISINGDVALSGLSILKIPIFVEAYRALDQPPNEYVQGLFYDTAVRSSNFGANLLLHEIAGVANTYEGAEVLTESMQRLGLVNTFMAIPYDAVAVSTRPNTYTTPANSVPGLITGPDPARQTTAEDMGTLLSMIYYCAQGGGALLAVYPGEITSSECQAIIDLMEQNIEGNLIRIGVPEDVPVSHKHGWDGLTYGDAGIVLSPGGDYVIVIYVNQASGWLASDISFPILWELSRVTYNYFNFTEPYLEDPQVRANREAEALEARTAAEEAELSEGGVLDTAVTPTPAP
jgi:beta-lactamase class A